MLLGGLWHGANWTYVTWGALHGVGLAAERGFERAFDRALNLRVTHRWWRRIVVFHFACLAFVFFRAGSLRQAVEFLGQLAHWSWQPSYASALLYLAIFTLPLLAIDLRLEQTGEEYLFQSARSRLQVATAAAALVAIAFLTDPRPNLFIYFRF